MLKDLIICGADDSYKAEVFKLHENSFYHLGNYDYLRNRFEQSFNQNNVFIALLEKELAGIISFDLVYGDRYCELKEYLKGRLNCSQTPQLEHILRGSYERDAKHLGIEDAVIVEYFKNIFTQDNIIRKDNVKPRENDIYIEWIAVDPKFQRKGVGQKLTEKIISFACQNHASAVYIDCLQDSGSEELHSKLGFLPIIRTGPTHNNGDSSLTMGLILKK